MPVICGKESRQYYYQYISKKLQSERFYFYPTNSLMRRLSREKAEAFFLEVKKQKRIRKEKKIEAIKEGHEGKYWEKHLEIMKQMKQELQENPESDLIIDFIDFQ